MAASKFGRLDGFAYQSPPPSYCRRAIVSGAARGALSAERGANAVSSAVTSTIAPIPSPSLRALRSAPHALRFALRSTLHMFLLFHDRVRAVPWHAELRDKSSDHIACAASLGGECARTRAHVRFVDRAWFRARKHDHDLTPGRRIVVVRAEHTHRSPTHFFVLLCHFAGHRDFFLPRSDFLEIGERIGQPRRRFIQHRSMWQRCELGEHRRTLVSFARQKSVKGESLRAAPRCDQCRQQRRCAWDWCDDDIGVERRRDQPCTWI